MSTSSAAVLLDIDGTLVDSTYHHAVAWQRAFARHELAPAMWRVHRAIGMGGDRLVQHLTDADTERRLGDDLRDAWREEYLALRREVRPLPGAADLVRRLGDTGYRIALASSGDPEFSREAVAMLDIADDIEVLTTSADVDASKPEPDLVGEALRQLGRQGDVGSAVFVGDTVYDVEAAGRAGLPCLALRSGGFGRDELEQAGAALVVDLPADLLDVDWSTQVARITPPAR